MAFHWNVSPEIFEVGPIRLRWYGVLFLSGFALGYQILKKICAWENKPQAALDPLLIYLILGTTLGARLGHCLFYEFDYFISHPLEILAIWKGGLASHGGGVGVIVALFLFSKKYPDFSFPWLLDRIAFPTAIAGGFIRLGNLMNSEIIGKPTGGDWGFIFDRIDNIPRHPTQIYESLCYFTIGILGYRIYLKYKKYLPVGLTFGFVMAGLYIARIFLEIFKENQESFEAGMFLNMGQILSIPYILIGLFFVFRALKNKNSIPVEVSKKNKKYSKIR